MPRLPVIPIAPEVYYAGVKLRLSGAFSRHTELGESIADESVGVTNS